MGPKSGEFPVARLPGASRHSFDEFRFLRAGSSMTEPRRSLIPAGCLPFAVTLNVAAAMINVSPATYLKMQAEGLMPKPRVFGRRKLYVLDEIRAALLALPTGDGDDDDPDDPWERMAA
jgi:hypothetical protein